MFEIISLGQKDRWNEIIRSMFRYDFYHLAEYHQLEDSGTSLLLYFSDSETVLSLPLILRPIEGTEYNDMTSVYGYAGPLSSKENPDEKSLKAFRKHLLQFFDSYKIVSVFSRLHPLFENQELFLSGLGKIVDTNLTVGIDLSLPEKEQKRQYAHSVKNNINRLKRKNVVVKKAQTQEEIDSFVEVYKENMERVKASKMYFFSNEYFHRFLEDLPSTLFIACHEGQIISGSLFTCCNGIVQPHLSATRNEFLRWSPMKYVWDQIRTDAIEKKEKCMHLGGGVGGSNDTLFEFKAQFSDLRFHFKTWKYIHNREIYSQLVFKKHKDALPESSFFPLYRL